jgi:glycosyltransferase involved in cell wall biosynthesis
MELFNMKILYVSRTFYPEVFGGGEISALYIAKSISKVAEPIVCCLSEKIDKPTVEFIDGIKIYRFPWKKLKFFKKLSNLEYCYWQVYKAVKEVKKKENPDIIHFLNTASIFPVMNFFNDVPKFSTCNSPWFCSFGGYHYGKSCYKCTFKEKISTSLKKWKAKGIFFLLYTEYSLRLLKISLKKCKKIFPVSGAMEKMLIENGISSKKLVIIHNPINLNKKINTNLRKKLGLENKKIILFVGRLSEDKGIQHVIKAIKELDVIFKIVGKGSFKRNLEILAKENNVEEKVKFIGFLDEKKLKEFYSVSNIAILTGMVYEALPRSLLEAASYGIPCITNNVGGNSEIIENEKNGIVLNSTNEQEIKTAINKILNNVKLSSEYSKNSRKKILEQFSLEIIGNKLIEEYKKSLKI